MKPKFISVLIIKGELPFLTALTLMIQLWK